MEISTILNLLLVAGAIHGFIFNVATFLSRKAIEKPVIYLNLFVFFLSMNNLQSWLIAKRYFGYFPFVENLIFPWYVLIVPMFYLFLVHYFGVKKQKKGFLLLTIGVFLTELLLQGYFLYLVDQGQYAQSDVPLYHALEDALTLGFSFFVFIKVILLVKRYPKQHPDILEVDNLRWVKRFLIWGVFIFVLWGVAVLFNIFSDFIKAPYSYYPLRVASSILIYWTGYQAFFRYAVLKNKIVLRKKNLESEQLQVEEADGTKIFDR